MNEASFCSQCGSPLNGSFKFCPQCGAPLALPADDLEKEIVRTLQQEGLIPAIKFYRTKTNEGLRESKEKVEALSRKYQISIPPPKGGCLGLLIGSLFLGLMVTTIGGAFTARVFSLAAPIVCNGSLEIGRNHFYCLQPSGTKKDMAFLVFGASTLLYSLIIFILFSLRKLWKRLMTKQEMTPPSSFGP